MARHRDALRSPGAGTRDRAGARGVTTQHQATSAFAAATGRVRWGDKLREDHRILAAIEKLMKRAAGGGHVPVARAVKVLPVVSVVVGAGTNAHVLGTVAKHRICHSQTVLLSRRYALPLPANLRREYDGEA